MKWQNLHDGKCPKCGVLMECIRPHKPMLKCMNEDSCDFLISMTSVERILDDPNHAANRHNRGYK